MVLKVFKSPRSSLYILIFSIFYEKVEIIETRVMSHVVIFFSKLCSRGAFDLIYFAILLFLWADSNSWMRQPAEGREI